MNPPLFKDAKALNERIEKSPLFSELEEDALDAVRFETELLFGSKKAKRPSYFRLLNSASGAILFSQGEYAEGAFVVLQGEVSTTIAEPRAGVSPFVLYAVDDWFGEASTLSDQPALFTATCESDVHLLEIDARFFRKLYEEDEVFHDRVDERYKEHLLFAQLKTVPLFAGLDMEELEALKNAANLDFIEKNEPLASQGDLADAVYLIRAGAVECRREMEDGRIRVVAYLRANSSFGEACAITDDATWQETYQSMSRVDYVRIEKPAFDQFLEEHPEAVQVITRTAQALLGSDDQSLDMIYSSLDRASKRQKLTADAFEVMVNRQSAKGGEALVIDQSKCIRCNACVESCVSVHEDRIPRISKVGTKVVTDEVLITACYNCEIPECMYSCGFGAIRRDPQGIVRFVFDNCTGCAQCVNACPYGVIRMTEPSRPSETYSSIGRSLAFLKSLPILSKLFTMKGSPCDKPDSTLVNFNGDEEEVQGKAIKCDLCAGLPFEACVYNCPTRAIERQSPEELFS